MCRILVLLLLAAVAVPISPLAHASIETSDASDRSIVAAAPGAIWAEVEEPLVAQKRERRERGLLDGIPLGSFAISLAISALIGAAGGKVYAGIMGPRA